MSFSGKVLNPSEGKVKPDICFRPFGEFKMILVLGLYDWDQIAEEFV